MGNSRSVNNCNPKGEILKEDNAEEGEGPEKMTNSACESKGTIQKAVDIWWEPQKY